VCVCVWVYVCVREIIVPSYMSPFTVFFLIAPESGVTEEGGEWVL